MFVEVCCDAESQRGRHYCCIFLPVDGFIVSVRVSGPPSPFFVPFSDAVFRVDCFAAGGILGGRTRCGGGWEGGRAGPGRVRCGDRTTMRGSFGGVIFSLRGMDKNDGRTSYMGLRFFFPSCFPSAQRFIHCPAPQSHRSVVVTFPGVPPKLNTALICDFFMYCSTYIFSPPLWKWMGSRRQTLPSPWNATFLILLIFLLSYGTPPPLPKTKTNKNIQYSDVAGVKYPGAYNDFLAVVDVVNLDLGFILSFACVVDTNFYDRLLMTTVTPAVVLCLLGCTYLVARRRNQHSDEVCVVPLSTYIAHPNDAS